jgi:glycosyltransferase involved in cell wall biosynthesis
VDSSLGIIVHSQQARRQIAAHNPRSPIAVVPAPIETYSGQLLSRQELGCPDEALVFVSAGQVTGRKQVDLALEAFARLRDDFPQALYVIVGEGRGGGQDLDGALQRWGLQDTVICTGYVTMQEFISWIAAADVMINLRYPTIGETSATALRGLVAGRPVIVSDHGWCAELPDDVCIKVPPNDVDAVLQAMRRLARDEVLRREVGHRAADYARREHSPACAAQRYVDFIESVLSGIIAKVGSLDKQGC